MNRRDFFRRASGMTAGAAIVAMPFSLLAEEKKDSPIVLAGATINGNVTMHGSEGIMITGCIVNPGADAVGIRVFSDESLGIENGKT